MSDEDTISGRAYLLVEPRYGFSGNPTSLELVGVRKRRPSYEAGRIVIEVTVRVPRPTWRIPSIDVEVDPMDPPEDAIKVEVQPVSEKEEERV